MQKTAWPLMACKPVVKTVNAFQRATQRLRPIGSYVRVDDARDGLRSGEAVWATQGPEQIHIAWAWIEVRPDVLALNDPMNIVCNVDLVEADGQLLAASRRILHLNDTVYRLDWRRVAVVAPELTAYPRRDSRAALAG